MCRWENGGCSSRIGGGLTRAAPGRRRWGARLLRVAIWSLTTVQQAIGEDGRLVKHARHYWLLLARGHLTRRLFGAVVRRIGLLSVPAG